jgi:hypothetical protein
MSAHGYWIRILHRDLGYFFAGITLIYALSGIAMNHADSWDPNFIIERKEVGLDLPASRELVTERMIRGNLERIGATGTYRTFDFPSSQRVKIYLSDGSIVGRLGERVGTYERISRRPLFYEVNFLHLNPKGWWKIFADLFCVALVIIVLSGVFLPRSAARRVVRNRMWLMSAGFVAPLLALVMLGWLG